MTEEIIIDGVNVAECEHYTTMEDCDGIHDLCEQLDDYCSIKKNCYYKQLKQAENTVNECHKYLAELEDKIENLEQELKWANDEEKYLKDCCIKAGKELEKHSFKWDSKEKNLVVQALQLNQLYEKLEQENKELKDLNKKICEDWEKEIKVYWNVLEEIREIAEKYKDMEGCRIPLGAIKMTIDKELNLS